MMTDDEPKEKSFLHGLAAAAVVAVVLTYSTRFMSVMDPKWAALVLFAALAGAAGAWTRVPAQGTPSPFRWLWAWLALSLAIRLTVAPPASWSLAYVFFAKAAVLLLAADILLALTAGRGRERLWQAFFWSAVVSAVLALGQYAGRLTALFPAIPAYGQPMYGVFGNQAILAAFWAAALPLTAVLAPEKRAARIAAGAGAALLVCAIGLSGSRGAWAGAALGLAAALPWRSGARAAAPIGLAVFVGGTAALVIAGRHIFAGMVDIGASLGLRRWFWDGALRTIADNPAWGVGPGNYRAHSPAYQGEALWAEGGESHIFNAVHTWHAHNDLLELAAEHGAAALIPFAMWIALLAWRGRGPLWGCLAALAAASLFNPVFVYPPHALLALAAAGHLFAEAGERPPRLGLRSLLLAGIGGAVIAWAVAPSYALRLAEDREMTDRDGLGLLLALKDEPLAPPIVDEKLGIAYMKREDYARARDAFESAIRNGGATGEAWLGYALCALYLGDAEGAYAGARSCLALWPADSDAWAVALAAAPEADRPALAQEAERWLAPGAWSVTEAAAADLRRFLDGER